MSAHWHLEVRVIQKIPKFGQQQFLNASDQTSVGTQVLCSKLSLMTRLSLTVRCLKANGTILWYK